jgi:hypothetical protein
MQRRGVTLADAAARLRRSHEWAKKWAKWRPVAPVAVRTDRVGPYRGDWCRRWNAMFGTNLTRADADAMVPQ